MKEELRARFNVVIPLPTNEDAYFPTELIASALDPHTKSLAFVPEAKRTRVLTPSLSQSLIHPHLLAGLAKD